jgi:VWFA-related protein
MSKRLFAHTPRSKSVMSVLLGPILCLSIVSLYAQESKQTKPSSAGDDVIRINANLVSFDVMVKDKKGKPLTNLKAEDFTVTENGVPQTIEFFDSTLISANTTSESTATTTRPGTTTPNRLPRNVIALVLDGQTTQGGNLKYVREGVTKYINERIQDSDSVALFAIAGGLQLLQPFTQNKQKLIAAAEKAFNVSTVSKSTEQRSIAESIAALRDQLAGAPTGEITTPAGGSAAAQAMISRRVLEQYVQLRSALSIQQTRPILASLAAICEGLRPIPGKKTLVMFSQGFVAPQVLDWQVQSTIDMANRANVTIYIIDSSGLTGGTPTSGALVPQSALSGISAATSQENRIRAGAGESVFDITRQEGVDRQQDLLYRISGDTGGQFIKNTNDIGQGLDRIDNEVRSRYTIAYRSTDSNFDGRFRKVKIAVRPADATVIARAGYNAIPPNQTMPFSPADRKTLDEFDTIAAHPTIPLSMQLSPFRAQTGYYTVPVSLEIPPDKLKFERQADKQLLQLDVLGVVRDENDGEHRIISRLGGNFNIALTTEQYEGILSDKVFFRQDIDLEPGTYTVDLLVKDRLSGKATAKREKLTLPVPDTAFSATDLVLSRHAQPATQPYLSSGDVLAEGGVLIRPSPSKEFRATDNLIIFFKLYNSAPAVDTGKPNVRVTLLLMKDGKLANKPVDYELTAPVPEPIPHLTFAKYIKLTGLLPGNYTLAVESRDMVQHKMVRQQVGFTITQ